MIIQLQDLTTFGGIPTYIRMNDHFAVGYEKKNLNPLHIIFYQIILVTSNFYLCLIKQYEIKAYI